MNIGKYNSPTVRTPTALPVKPLLCSLCSFTARLGRNELQLHLDSRHAGWAQDVIKKITVGRGHIRSSNAINLQALVADSAQPVHSAQ